MSRLLTDKELHKITGPIFDLSHEQVAEASQAKTLKAVGEWLEAKLMLKSEVVVSSKTLKEVIIRQVEALKRGELPE